MNTHFTYLMILAASLAGPLLLSFDKKVAFYKHWKALFMAMLLPALFYIIWDSFFISRGVWSFNEAYITGIRLYNVPLEEVLFFFVVPYCCVFIYACVRAYFPRLGNTTNGDRYLMMLAVVLLALGLYFPARHYTSWTFVLNAVCISLLILFRLYFRSFNTMAFLVSFAIILLPFLAVNGLLTAIPVVLYNNAENLGIRIYTIPVEDVFYGMLLIFLNIVFYEKLLKRN
jgi:lycopene cyclase domain-containing protein